MKVAIPVEGESLGANVDSRFGRAKYIIVADLKTLHFRIIEGATGKTHLGPFGGI